MRIPGLALALAFVFAAATVVVAIRAGRGGGEPDYSTLDVHPPETAAERAAAAVGLRYARAVQDRDAAAACRLTAAPLARDLRCTARPRLRACTGDRVYHAKNDDGVVDVRLDACQLKDARRAGGWRVIEQPALVEYAALRRGGGRRVVEQATPDRTSDSRGLHGAAPWRRPAPDRATDARGLRSAAAWRVGAYRASRPKRSRSRW